MDQATHSPLMIFPTMAVGLVTLALIGWIISLIVSAWGRGRQIKQQHELKVLMIQRGMSADEMERVLAAGTGKQHQLLPQDETPPAKPQAGPIKWPVHSDN